MVPFQLEGSWLGGLLHFCMSTQPPWSPHACVAFYRDKQVLTVDGWIFA